MDYGALPPEINSARMYAGAGSGPLLTAAAAWDGLAEDLYSTAASYGAVISALTGDAWSGPSSASMAAAGATYKAWITSTAGQAEQAATHARLAAAAYHTAFAMTVPPPAIAANRSLLAALVATNFLGQNTPAIAATEAQYAEMWAQDAAAMYGYAGSSASASLLTPFTAPTPTTNAAGWAAQSAAVAQAAASAAGAPAPDRDVNGPAIDIRAAPGAAEPRITGVVLVVANRPTGQLGPVRGTRGRGNRRCRCSRGVRGFCAGSREHGGAGLGDGFRWRRLPD